MKRWGTIMMSVGGGIFIGSALLLGNSTLNAVGAVLILFPPVLFVIRYVEEKITFHRPAR
ncbi:hypothetical protein [Sanguibacter antarcticus]|uniref:Uncharacterized protein n=1 Tax=Sanguibacter antarcticus TaxID=372484 RepID=A0A2A9E902_9MICO|nr:hypothetical protein [Sanguibacter antarcticus]PFG32186.1 hypothetical protein ATL42_0003 [Sanguibacter antarcticus]PFG35303.1 hypothetical protein ATL42_3247 [Sanguibacter antarcticus]